MAEELLSVGLDVGTTTTQLILSRLRVENRGSAFSVPEMVIDSRQVIYRSPVYFTPLLGKDRVDGEEIRKIVDREYEKAGIRREEVDTGAIIITGETSRKENAAAVLEALSGFAGEFVVATAGPDLESILAARGAGAAEYSARTGERVLHMDIGGGTSNLALIREGKIVKTGCLNVGGRLVKLTDDGVVTYMSPVLEELCSWHLGQRITREDAEKLAEMLVRALEMAAGLREPTELLEKLWTVEAEKKPEGIAADLWGASRMSRPTDGTGMVLSFSGGVADCIDAEHFWLEFGDIGPVLGQKIRESRLCKGKYRLGAETIRATVIGAGCHSVQLSGSTVFYQNVSFPMKNLPVVADVAQLARLDGPGVLAMPGTAGASYGQVRALAAELAEKWPEQPVLIAVEADMAKALGGALALGLGPDRPILCIDRVRLGQGDYLDVAAPVGPAMPVVVKTLVLG